MRSPFPFRCKLRFTLEKLDILSLTANGFGKAPVPQIVNLKKAGRKEAAMAHEQEVLKAMERLEIADKHLIGEIMSVQVGWQKGVSATNQAYKALSSLAELGKIEKHKGYFRLPGCKSEFGEHSRLITKAIAEMLINYPDSIIYREHFIPEIGLRPDAIVLLIKGRNGFCFVLEVMNNETLQEVERKIRVWQQWDGASRYLSSLFKMRIPHYEIITIEGGKKICADKLPRPP